VSDNLDESQDWPLRDYSARLRPPRPSEGPAEAQQEPAPEVEPEPSFDPPPTSSSDVEVLYDEDEPAIEPSVVPDDQPPVETPEASVEAPEVEVPEPEAPEPESPEPETPDPEAPEPEAPGEEVAEPADAPPPPAESAATDDEQHAEGDLRIPDGTSVLEGSPNGNRRTVAIVVSKFNGEITGRLLDSAMAALDEAGVSRDAVLVMPVPGAFELPIAAMALAKTRRYSCVIALGCVIRGQTPHFDFVAGEAASGLQLAGIETGVPVSFGLLTCDTAEQAEERVDRGGWAARTALEMADAFAQLRTAVARG
jgi:6,7-dimethyl-8-ribityllumazine synthase